MTGTHLADVLETIDYATNEARTPEGEHVWVELTTLLIPGLNDDDAQLHAECTWIREHLGPDVPLHFSAFHPSYRMMDVPPTPHETLTHARDIALEEGLNYVYTGNVHDREGDTTYCPNPECRAKLVERDWYRIIANCISVRRDDDGRCPSCGTVRRGVRGFLGISRSMVVQGVIFCPENRGNSCRRTVLFFSQHKKL